MSDCKYCLFYEERMISFEGMSFPASAGYCHCNDGVYDVDTEVFIQSILKDDCEDYVKGVNLRLSEIEEEYGITILYAVESGSRMWGFSNKDSDFDIRFIFRYNDIKEYVKLSGRKEVINFIDGVFDFEGWDISKALFLHYKNNPSLREWLLSPIKYIDSGLLDVLKGRNFNKEVLLHHYKSMALNNWKDFCEGIYNWLGQDDEVRMIKKYLYVLRCILTFDILRGSDLNPSIEIHGLLKEHILMFHEDDLLYESILLLIERYSNHDIKVKYRNIEFLYEFIENSLRDMREYCAELTVVNDSDLSFYDDLLYEILFMD